MARRLSSGLRQNVVLLGLVTAGWMTATTALGQADQRQVMVIDDGGGPQVLHFTQPDFRSLREPDYVRSDLPIFSDKLKLSETQAHVVRERLDEYLEAFKDLALETLPAPRGEMNAFTFGHDEDGGGGGAVVLEGAEGLESIVMEALHGEEGISGLDIDADDFGGGGGAIAVTIEASSGSGPVFDAGDGSETQLVGVAVAPSDGSMWVSDGGTEGDVVIAIDSQGGAEIPEELLERLEAKAQELAEQMQEMDFEEGGPGEAMMFESIEDRQAHNDELAEKAKKFKGRKNVLTSQFVSDVQAQLSAEQLGRWPHLERTLTRRKSLPKGRLDGEKTDLIDVLESLDPAAAADEDLDQQLAAYEQSIYSALVSRDAYLESSARDIDRAIKEGDMEKALSIADRAAALRVGVRNVNAQYGEVFVQQLAPSDAERFRDAALRRSHPRIYRPTPAQRAFGAARKLPDLGDDDKSNIVALEQSYRSELDAMNGQIRRTVLKHQPKESRKGIEHVASMMQGEAMAMPHGEGDPIHEAYAKRNDLDERYVRSLHGLLTPEQIEQLPKKRKKRNQPIIIRESGRNPF